jgi:hypothetical protein
MGQNRGLSQAPPNLPPEVLQHNASVVGVVTTPPGGKVSVDGKPVPTMPFILLKKDKPRLLRFELTGYKALEKEVDPGAHYIVGIGVDFVKHQVGLVERDPEVPVANTPVAPPSQPAPAAEASLATAPQSTESKPTSSQTQNGPVVHPFGFDYGMTKDQAIAKLGKAAIVKDTGATVVFNTAPNGHPDFESYILAFSPEAGLLKIRAVSLTYKTSDDGSELRQKFVTFRDALAEKYGPAEKDFDFCKGNDVECRSEFFMMTLLEKNRYLNSYWTAAKCKMPLHIQTMSIDAIALGINKGYIEIAYEFDGWDKFVDDVNRKRNSSF